MADPFDAFGTDLSHRTARRIWTAFGLQPHRSETFRPSADPPFVDKLQDIGGLYPSPPNRAIYRWMRIQIQAPDREQPVLPMASGMAERRVQTFVRDGTMSLFAALDIATGAVIGKCCRHHIPTEFLDILKQINRQMLEGQTCMPPWTSEADHKTVRRTVFLPNVTKKTRRIQAWLARHPHWHMHFTPTLAAGHSSPRHRHPQRGSKAQLRGGVRRRHSRLCTAILPGTPCDKLWIGMMRRGKSPRITTVRQQTAIGNPQTRICDAPRPSRHLFQVEQVPLTR